MSSMDMGRAIVKNSDMTEEMQQCVIECAREALDQYSIEKDIAVHIKKHFDKEFSPTWHCIVGKNFGSYVTHEEKRFIYFYIDHIAILLYKSG